MNDHLNCVSVLVVRTWKSVSSDCSEKSGKTWTVFHATWCHISMLFYFHIYPKHFIITHHILKKTNLSFHYFLFWKSNILYNLCKEEFSRTSVHQFVFYLPHRTLSVLLPFALLLLLELYIFVWYMHTHCVWPKQWGCVTIINSDLQNQGRRPAGWTLTPVCF